VTLFSASCPTPAMSSSPWLLERAHGVLANTVLFCSNADDEPVGNFAGTGEANAADVATGDRRHN